MFLLQADVFSFGIVLYQLAAGGHPPYSRQFRNEMDAAVLQCEPIEPITMKGYAPWPDMEELIGQCVEQIPEDRPTVSAC